MKVLAGDIGGTKTLLQLSEVTANQVQPIYEKSFDSRAHSTFDSVLVEFLAEGRDALAKGISACIGVAGPVQQNQATVTNLPWRLDANALASRFDLSQLTLINDFQAIGYGIDALVPDDLLCLQEGQSVPHGTRALIGAGTGLGEGILAWQGDRYEVLPSEGGHADFAPTDDVQIELLQFLRAQHEVVSYEHVVSGPGLESIFHFLQQKHPERVSGALTAAITVQGIAPAVSQFALSKQDPVAELALDMFVKIYGAQAGNLALTCLARGGVYIAGGIAPRITDKLVDGTFMRAFTRKVKMRDLMARFPVLVVTNPKVGLLGAALHASMPTT